jgi:Fe-S cluster assembly protein SufD
MSDWTALEAALVGTAATAWHLSARHQFATLAKPHRQAEDWRPLPVAKLQPALWETPSLGEQARSAQQVDSRSAMIAFLDQPLFAAPACRLVFCDGYLDTDLSTPEAQFPAGLRLVPWDLSADADAPCGYWDGLNAAALQPASAWQLHLAAGVQLVQPVQILYWVSGATSGYQQCRLRWVQGEASSAQLLEVSASLAASPLPGILNQVTELQLADSARCDHLVIARGKTQSWHFWLRRARLAQQAQLSSWLVAWDCSYRRCEWLTECIGERASYQGHAVYAPTGKERFGLFSRTHHQAPECQSASCVRGLVAGEARAAFRGAIAIAESGQQTEADLSVKHLLLSENAEVFAKPELTIFADDVKCSHGATLAALDADALHYLRARGIDAAKASRLLSLAFAQAPLAQVPALWRQPLLDQLQMHLAELGLAQVALATGHSL